MQAEALKPRQKLLAEKRAPPPWRDPRRSRRTFAILPALVFPCMERCACLDGGMIRWLLLILGLAIAAPASAEWALSPLGNSGSLGRIGDPPFGTGGHTRRPPGANHRGVFQDRDAVFQVIDNPPSARVPLSVALNPPARWRIGSATHFHEDFTPLGPDRQQRHGEP